MHFRLTKSLFAVGFIFGVYSSAANSADEIENSRTAFDKCAKYIRAQNELRKGEKDFLPFVDETCLRDTAATDSFSVESFHGIGDVDSNFQSYRPSYFGFRIKHRDNRNEGEVKFQLSLKYQITNDDENEGQLLNYITDNWYFGYTQKSFWSIHKSSEPFRETNFSPEIFKEFKFNNWEKDDSLKIIRFGLFQHESTGEDGLNSRGWNITYIEPIYKFGKFSIAPKLWIPALFRGKSDMAPDNPDIFDFYGKGEFKLFYEHSPLIKHSLMYRQGNSTDRYGFRWQTDMAIKLYEWNPKIFIQYWSGYGESLIDYNRKTYGWVVGLSAVH